MYVCCRSFQNVCSFLLGSSWSFFYLFFPDCNCYPCEYGSRDSPDMPSQGHLCLKILRIGHFSKFSDWYLMFEKGRVCGNRAMFLNWSVLIGGISGEAEGCITYDQLLQGRPTKGLSPVSWWKKKRKIRNANRSTGKQVIWYSPRWSWEKPRTSCRIGCTISGDLWRGQRTGSDTLYSRCSIWNLF